MIEAKNLNKYFGDRHVLIDVSHHFEKGQTNLVIGQKIEDHGSVHGSESKP